MEHRYAFVLRIWLSESSSASGNKVSTLRGTLQATDSAEPIHFHSLRQLNDILDIAIQPGDHMSTSSD